MLQVAGVNMETLTLARYICELSLLEIELVSERASQLACACLLLALITKDLGGWVREGDTFRSMVNWLPQCENWMHNKFPFHCYH